MNIRFINEKHIPDYVFDKKYETFLFVDSSEALCNQNRELIIILVGALKKVNSGKLLSFDVVNDREMNPIKEFDFQKESPENIAQYFLEYTDEFDIPYYRIAASLLFIDENHSLCFYGDRISDICIIGCSKTISENIRTSQAALMNNQYFLNFMDVNEYITYLKEYLPAEDYKYSKEQILINYS